MEDTLIFKVKGNDYTIQFPSVGKFRRIEALKQALSNGMYNALVKTNTESAQSAADMVDIESIITVTCPALLKDLKCESFEDLGMKDYSELRKAFEDQFMPWWNRILKEVGLSSEK